MSGIRFCVVSLLALPLSTQVWPWTFLYRSADALVSQLVTRRHATSIGVNERVCKSIYGITTEEYLFLFPALRGTGTTTLPTLTSYCLGAVAQCQPSPAQMETTVAAYLARLYRCYLIGCDVEWVLKETLRSTCATFTCANPVYRCGLVREKAEVVAYYTVPRPVYQ